MRSDPRRVAGQEGEAGRAGRSRASPDAWVLLRRALRSGRMWEAGARSCGPHAPVSTLGRSPGGPPVPCRLSTVYSGDLASSRDSATEIPESDVRLGAVDAPRITTPLLAGFLLGGDQKRGAVTAEDAHVEVWAGRTLRESGGGRGFVERRATCQVTRGARGHTWGNRFASQRAPSVLTVTFLTCVSVILVQDHRAELSRPARGPCGSLRL